MYTMKTIIFPLLFLLTTAELSAQNSVTLSGRVLDSGTREPLPECNIYLSDFNYGTVTDSLGKFELRIPVSESGEFLIASFVGYLKYSIKVSEIRVQPVNIAMDIEFKLLDEIIIRENAGTGRFDLSDLPWNYPEMDPDYADSESPEVKWSFIPR